MAIAGPNGRCIFGMVKVGAKGQIVIPKEARDIFGIKPGDSVLLLGDTAQGLAIITSDIMIENFKLLSGEKNIPEVPNESDIDK